MTLDQEDIAAIAVEVVRQLRQLFIATPVQAPKRTQQTLQSEQKMSPISDPLLLTPKEAAAKLATTIKTLETWLCQGKGPKFVKIGRSVRYRMSDVQEYIKQLSSDPAH